MDTDQYTQKLSSRGRPSKYEPKVMCDDTVYQLALVGLTQEEVSSFFGVTREAMRTHHQEAFDRGKADQRLKPRLIVFKTLDLLQEKFEQQLAEVGEFAMDSEGNETRIPVDTKLGKLVLDYAEAANRYLPKEIKVEVTKNPYTELSDEELISRISELKETK